MGFSTNYSEVKEGTELIPKGKYEVIIGSAEFAETKGGTKYIDVRMVIRNDIRQSCQNRIIFHKIWKVREPSANDAMTEGYSFKQLMSLASGLDLPSGKNYASVAELARDFVGKCCNAEVIIEHDDNYGDKNSVRYINKTKCLPCAHQMKQSTAKPAPAASKPANAFTQPQQKTPAGLEEFEDITDNDTPF